MTGVGAKFRAGYDNKCVVLRNFARSLAQPNVDVKQVRQDAAVLQSLLGRGAVVDAIAVVAFFAAISRLVDSSNHRRVTSSSEARTAKTLAGVAVAVLVAAVAVVAVWR